MPDPTTVLSEPVGMKRDGDWFETITQASGVDFRYRNGAEANRTTLVEDYGGGAAFLDYDLDGEFDLFLTGGGTIPVQEGEIQGHPPALFRKTGPSVFQRVDQVAGLTESGFYSHGCAVADFNRDGFADIAVAGFGGVMLYANLGDGTFEERAKDCRLTSDGMCMALAWSDLDLDGWADLFVLPYVDWMLETNVICRTPDGQKKSCDPTTYAPTKAFLFRNEGNGLFTEAAASWGLHGTANGLGVVAADFNADGRCEYYVASDETDNLFYVRDESGLFQETAHLAGVATDEFGNDEGSMGIAVADYNGDARPDIFVTNFEREDNSLYQNQGAGVFLHASQSAGLSGPSRRYVGFGTALTDFDGDGWPDLLIANGHVFQAGGLAPYRQPPQLFHNQQGERFVEVSTTGGEYFRRQHVGRGLAVSDIDDDGGPDVVIVHQNDPVEVLRNRRPPKQFLRIQLQGTTSIPEAIGAEVRLRDGDRVLAQWVASGCSYLSQHDPRLTFSLTQASEAATVVVRWPTGLTETFSDLTHNRTHRLVEGHGQPAAAE